MRSDWLWLFLHRRTGAGDVMGERVTAWQCIGCGRIEGSQPCIGVCQDRKVDFVYASDYDEALARRTLAALGAGDPQ